MPNYKSWLICWLKAKGHFHKAMHMQIIVKVYNKAPFIFITELCQHEIQYSYEMLFGVSHLGE